MQNKMKDVEMKDEEKKKPEEVKVAEEVPTDPFYGIKSLQ